MVNNLTNMSTIFHLTLGNVTVDQEFINFLFDNILPSLYSLDIFKLKCIGGLEESNIFKRLDEKIENEEFKSLLMRLRISNINLNP